MEKAPRGQTIRCTNRDFQARKCAKPLARIESSPESNNNH